MTASIGGLYPALPAAPLALGACTSLVRTVAGSLVCVAAATAVPRGAAALLPVPLWPLGKQNKQTHMASLFLLFHGNLTLQCFVSNVRLRQ